jgi:response regulator RpfG family c-di-GMP phosphodiesterase
MRQNVLVIDDQTSNAMLVAEILSGISMDIDVVTFAQPLEAVRYAAENPLDLVITDFSMPELDGLGVIRLLKRLEHLFDVPIVVVTAHEGMDVRYAALDAGAADFLTRPINHRECQSRCRNLLKMRLFQRQNKRHAEVLEQRVAEVTEDLQSRSMEMLRRLAVVAEKRDSETGQHLVRMARYSKLLARETGFSESEVHVIGMAAPLHDIGKIGIPDGILLAPRRLSDSELAIMRTHPDIGYEMLQGSTSESMKMSADIARYHHERFDGSGYPLGLRGEDIPLSARIVAVADVWDALLTARPYKRPWTEEAAIDMLRRGAGAHFDPTLVDAFLANLEALRSIRHESDLAETKAPPDY